MVGETDPGRAGFLLRHNPCLRFSGAHLGLGPWAGGRTTPSSSRRSTGGCHSRRRCTSSKAAATGACWPWRSRAAPLLGVTGAGPFLCTKIGLMGHIQAMPHSNILWSICTDLLLKCKNTQFQSTQNEFQKMFDVCATQRAETRNILLFVTLSKKKYG